MKNRTLFIAFVLSIVTLQVCCAKDDLTAINRTSCGFRNPDGIGFRIVNDNDNEAYYGEFPWMVAVLYQVANLPQQNLYKCGAVLIHPQVVITAAHCVDDKNRKYKIRAGEWDTQTKYELYPHQDREVKTIITHPEFDAGTLNNDIAMLILASPVDLAENVQTVCLPPQDTVIDTGTCYVSGWGKDVSGKEGKYSVILKRLHLSIVERNTCQEKLRTTALGKSFELPKSFICADGESGKDTCKGDDGSPLVCPIANTKNRFYQMGIVTWRFGCDENNTPGTYVNLPLFRNWIDDQMKLNNFETGTYQY